MPNRPLNSLKWLLITMLISVVVYIGCNHYSNGFDPVNEGNNGEIRSVDVTKL